MAANTLGSAVLKVGLDAAEFTSGLSKIEYQMGKLGTGLKKIAIGAGLGFQINDAINLAKKTLYDFTLGTISAKSHLQDLSVQMGISVEVLAGLAKVGKYSNTSLEEITGASNRMTRAMAGANEKTSGAGRALKGLGINFAEFKNQAPEDQLVTVAKAMAGFKDGTDKSAAAMLLFGRSGAPFLRFLKELGERGILPSKQTSEAAKMAKEYEDNLITLENSVSSLKVQIGSALLPTLLEFTQALIDSREAFGGWASAIWEMGTWNPFQPFKDPDHDLPTARENLKLLREELEKLDNRRRKPSSEGEDLKEMKARIFPGGQPLTEKGVSKEGLKAAIKDQEEMIAYLERRRKQNKQTQEALALGKGVTETAFIQGLLQKKLNVSGETEASRYLESLRKQLIATKDLTAADKVRLAVREGLEGLTPGIEKEILGAAGGLDVLRRQEDRKKMLEDLGKGTAALAQLEQDASDAAATAWAKQLTDGVEELKMMGKTNDALREETALIGKNAFERAAAQAAKLQEKEITPREKILQNLDGVSGEVAGARRAQLIEEINKLKENRSLILQKANADEVSDLKAGNAALSEEIAVLGMNAEARLAYNNALLESSVNMKLVLAASQDESEEGNLRRKALEKEVDLLRERQSLETSKFQKQVGVDLRDQADAAGRTLAESISEGILDGFRRGTSFADIFIRELKAQFAKTILTPIIQPAVSQGNAFINDLFSSIAGSFGFGKTGRGADSGIFGSEAWTNPPGKSGGGAVNANSLYRVNEQRMEGLRVNGEQFLLMGDKGGTIDSAPRMRGGLNIIQNNQFGSNISRNEIANAARQAQATLKAEILRSVQLNGVFSGA